MLSDSWVGAALPETRAVGSTPGPGAPLQHGDFLVGGWAGGWATGETEGCRFPGFPPDPPSQAFWGWSQEIWILPVLPESSEEGATPSRIRHLSQGENAPVLQFWAPGLGEATTSQLKESVTHALGWLCAFKDSTAKTVIWGLCDSALNPMAIKGERTKSLGLESWGSS